MIKLNNQNDPSWGRDSMALPEDQLGRYGCVVTCVANIIQLRDRMNFTPQNLNNILKLSHGYKETPEDQASFIRWSFIEKKYKFKVINNLFPSQFRQRGYHIARIIFSGYGHYVNVLQKLEDYFLIFDVWHGGTSLIHRTDVTKLIRLESRI